MHLLSGSIHYCVVPPCQIWTFITAVPLVIFFNWTLPFIFFFLPLYTYLSTASSIFSLPASFSFVFSFYLFTLFLPCFLSSSLSLALGTLIWTISCQHSSSNFKTLFFFFSVQYAFYPLYFLLYSHLSCSFIIILDLRCFDQRLCFDNETSPCGLPLEFCLSDFSAIFFLIGLFISFSSSFISSKFYLVSNFLNALPSRFFFSSSSFLLSLLQISSRFHTAISFSVCPQCNEPALLSVFFSVRLIPAVFTLTFNSFLCLSKPV